MKKSRFVAFAALLMALLLLVCSCGNSASTTPKASGTQSGGSETETVRTDFESNEEHLSYVLNRGNISGGLGGVYDAVLAALKGTGSATAEKVHGKGQSTLEISEELLALLAASMELEADELKSLGSLTGKTEISMDAGKIQTSIGLLLGDQEFTTVDVIIDQSTGKIYYHCPTLSEEYAEVTLGDMVSVGEGTDFSQMIGLLFAGQAAQLPLPEGEILDKLVAKYVELLTAELKNVEKIEETLTAGGVSQEVYKFTVRVDKSLAMSGVKSVLTAAKQDEDIRKIITDLCDSEYIKSQSDLTSEEVYQGFVQKIDELLKDLEDEGKDETDGISFPLEFYVDKENNLVGVNMYGVLTTATDSEESTVMIPSEVVEVLRFFQVTDGNKQGFVLSLNLAPFSSSQALPKVILEGGFEETDQGVNGEVTLKMSMAQGDTSLSVAIGKLTVSDLVITEETQSGSLTFALDSGLSQMIPMGGEGEGTSVLQMLLGTQIRYTFRGGAKEASSTLEITSGGKKLISLNSSLTVDDQAAVTVPSEAVTMEEYMASVNPQKFVERAKELGLNEKVLEAIWNLISGGRRNEPQCPTLSGTWVEETEGLMALLFEEDGTGVFRTGDQSEEFFYFIGALDDTVEGGIALKSAVVPVYYSFTLEGETLKLVDENGKSLTFFMPERVSTRIE